MTADEEKPAGAAPPRIQFSLGTLLLLPVAVGCALAVLFTKPINVAAKELYVIALLSPAGLTSGIVYGKGYTRAFCIGALFPAGALFLLNALQFTDMFYGQVQTSDVSFTLQCLFGGGWLAAIVSGCLCMGIRWFTLGSAAADGSTRRHGWGRAILTLFLVLLILSGPILGRIGISLGWWKADAPSLNPYAPPVPSAAPYIAPTTTYPSTPYTAPTTGYYPVPTPVPDPSGADASTSSSPGPLPVSPPPSGSKQ
jgi:hypothetical protein